MANPFESTNIEGLFLKGNLITNLPETSRMTVSFTYFSQNSSSFVTEIESNGISSHDQNLCKSSFTMKLQFVVHFAWIA